MEITQKPKLRLRHRKHLTGLALAATREALRKELEPNDCAQSEGVRQSPGRGAPGASLLRGTYEEARQELLVPIGAGAFKRVR